jgi:hypothetical protein
VVKNIGIVAGPVYTTSSVACNGGSGIDWQMIYTMDYTFQGKKPLNTKLYDMAFIQDAEGGGM